MSGPKEGEGERKGKVISLVVVLFGEEDGFWWSNKKKVKEVMFGG